VVSSAGESEEKEEEKEVEEGADGPGSGVRVAAESVCKVAHIISSASAGP
jgi:hypothetical protein